MVTSACLSLSVLGPIQPQLATAHKDCMVRYLDWSWYPLSKSHSLQVQIEFDSGDLLSGERAPPLPYCDPPPVPNQFHRLERLVNALAVLDMCERQMYLVNNRKESVREMTYNAQLAPNQATAQARTCPSTQLSPEVAIRICACIPV